jgi:FlaA1/EpsC-like NDP-sugar epimerase
MITGGTGSLGKALIKKIKKEHPDWKIVVFSRDEGKQALSFGNDPSIVRIIGDIRDLTKVDVSMRLHKPNYVIHAAALKRVDDMEFHPDECVKTNVIGSQNVATAALANNVEKCMLVSTDKACQPVNVYGSSKFIAERVFSNFDYNSDSTIFASVRYGNVIASRGSFIPNWIEKIKNGEEITITDPECTRFLFTLENAVDTVMTSMFSAIGGEVFVPGLDSYTIPDVICALELITGVCNVETRIIGLRPGEKLHEDMMSETEMDRVVSVQPTENYPLYAILPQFTRKEGYSTEKYEGDRLNSGFCLDSTLENLVDKIRAGVVQ